MEGIKETIRALVLSILAESASIKAHGSRPPPQRKNTALQDNNILKLSLYSSLTAALLAPITAIAMDLPSSFDLRDIDSRSYIGAVRDQSACGSCYSFGALAAAESTWNRAHDSSGEQAIDLSEAFIVWSLSPLYDGVDGCDGASYDFKELTALQEHGVPLEQDFPYTIDDPGADLHWDANRYQFHDWYRIPVNDIETIKRVLSQIGAVDAAVLTDDAFFAYSEGVFANTNTVISDIIPYYSNTDHLIALIGWNDAPQADGMGTWTLRNSWGSGWGEEGYMQIGYTSAKVALEAAYLTAASWSEESVVFENRGEVRAVPWSSGGTLNAHGVDLWGGAASAVTNRGAIVAEVSGANELATARGVYLWGGPDGQVTNSGEIDASAFSQENQAIAYGICLQGGWIDNAGSLSADARSQADQSLAFGIWAANGGSPLEISTSGSIFASASGGDLNAAYGIWADSRAGTTVTNSGVIEARGREMAVGVLLTGGAARLDNSGAIEAFADPSSGQAIGVLIAEQGTLVNSGTISGASNSIAGASTLHLILQTGSDLIGPVWLGGYADVVWLAGMGREDEVFSGAETLIMNGVDWSLSGNSAFDAILVEQGRLSIDGVIGGNATVRAHGVLGGNGALTGAVTNLGTISPGHSIGHLTIDGDLHQGASGTLGIEIGNGQADRLTVTGAASLDGTLLIVPNGYASGGSFSLLNAGSISGAFAQVRSAAILDTNLLSPSPGSLSLDVRRNSYTELATSHNHGLAASLDPVRPSADNDFADLLDRLDLA